MYDYRHILFPVDFSDHAETVARQVAELARESGAKVTLLHVIANFPEDIPNDWIAPEDEPPRKYLLQRCERALSELAHRTGLGDAERACLMTSHSARHAIVEFADEQQADLIVMGSHGRGHGTLGALIGSVTAGVVGSARQDVLVVR